jgi:hypothetical protein
MPMRPLGFNVRRRLRSRTTGCSIVEGIDDENRVQRVRRQPGNGLSCSSTPSDVGEAFALHAPLNGFDHQSLDIFGVDEPPRTHAAGETNSEPPAAGISPPPRCLSDLQSVHHLLVLPGFAIGGSSSPRSFGENIRPRRWTLLRGCPSATFGASVEIAGANSTTDGRRSRHSW